jgi:hypothetical protein
MPQSIVKAAAKFGSVTSPIALAPGTLLALLSLP